jgi:PAS domain S-box-containing protein
MKQEQVTQERQIIRMEGMDHFFLPFHLFSTNGSLLYLNPAAQKRFSNTKEDLTGKSIFELYPEVEGVTWANALDKLKGAANESVNLSSHIQISHITIENTVYIQLVILPESKKQADKNIGPEFLDKKQFKKLYNKSEHFISLLDTKGILLDLNDRALSIGGAEEALGQHLWQTLSDSKLNKEYLEEAIHKAANGLSATFQAEMNRQDGSTVLMEFVLKPVNDKSGKINYILSEGKEVLQAIRKPILKGEEIYRRIGRSLSKGGILIVDRSLKYVLAEGSIFIDLGFDAAADMENKTLDKIHEPRTLKLLKPAFERALLGQARSFEATARNGRIYSPINSITAKPLS